MGYFNLDRNLDFRRRFDPLIICKITGY